jgi:hypothetical protein
MKIETPAKRKEILFSRTQMEVMKESGLLELAKHGTPYERMHARGILDDRRAGQVSTHGRSATYTSLERTNGNANERSGYSDSSLRRRNRQS